MKNGTFTQLLPWLVNFLGFQQFIHSQQGLNCWKVALRLSVRMVTLNSVISCFMTSKVVCQIILWLGSAVHPLIIRVHNLTKNLCLVVFCNKIGAMPYFMSCIYSVFISPPNNDQITGKPNLSWHTTLWYWKTTTLTTAFSEAQLESMEVLFVDFRLKE